MAEKKFIKGLFKDTAHIDQPAGTWRHARNMVLTDTDGAVSNESGTELDGHLGINTVTGDENAKVVGAIRVDSDRQILYTVDVVNSVNPRSEIGIWENGTYTQLYNPDVAATGIDLSFNENNPIEGTFKIDSKGDLVIYWTDDLNPPRAFNVNRQLRDSTSVDNLYGIFPLNSINILNLFPHSGPVPRIEIQEDIYTGTGFKFQKAVTEGGALLTAVYYLALAYVDDDVVATNYLSVSNPISIVDEYDFTSPNTKKDGAKSGSQTSKAINWSLTNLNLNYKYIRSIVIRKMGDSTVAFKLDDLEIDPTNSITNPQIVTFSGTEGIETVSIEDVMIDTVSYDTAKTVQQLDGVLYLGNTTSSKDVGYQKYANAIELTAKTKTIPDFDKYFATADGLHTGFSYSPVNNGNVTDASNSYRYIPNIYNFRGYQRDEVYSFYIAFVLNDGSMSYAYHIPGRKSISSSNFTNYNGLDASFTQERDLAPTTVRDNYGKESKLFHFYDTTTLEPTAQTRNMQYWENASELYPNTDNYDVLDGVIVEPSLKGENVRHHHFPSNENEDFCSVKHDGDSSIISDSVYGFTNFAEIQNNHYQGQFMIGVNNILSVDQGNTNAVNTWDNPMPLQWFPAAYHIPLSPYNWTTSDIPFSGGATGQGTTFTATAPNTLMQFGNVQMRADNDNTVNRTWNMRCMRNINNTGWVTVSPSTTSMATCTSGFGCSTNVSWNYSDLRTELGDAGGCDEHVTRIGDYYPWQIPNMNPGDQVRFEYNYSGDNVKIASGAQEWATCDDDNARNNLRGKISIVNPIDISDYRDVTLTHKVKALGFELSKVKIPQDIADKVQGFRIYRSKREDKNKRILGQSVLIPMKTKFGILGLCEEAVAAGSAAGQNMGVVSDTDETFLLNDSWALHENEYVVSTQTSENNTGQAYKTFSFHDFYLLRTRSSVAAATHIKAEYVVGNYTFNGPGINQDKKMLTEIGTVKSDSGAYEVTERWGWDGNGATAQNCYPKEINSAIFLGGRYMSTGVSSSANSVISSAFTLHRPLHQKAKSYILGDSIFDGRSLGFQGKIANLAGESHLALALKDGWELPALKSRPSSGSAIDCCFGKWQDEAGPMLIGANSTDRHKSYIVNLHSYKTDVYKSIDTNELVWTGFEVLGKDDLDNFVFNAVGSPVITGGDFKTSTIKPEGIFGGDIFLSRYGIPKSVAPRDTASPSTPNKALYYHIVESTDNISLRHAESANSEYFPSNVSSNMIKNMGTEGYDYMEQDNMKYNNNYSLDSDIRPAFPLPLRDNIQTDFPTRTHRSAKNDTTSLIDNWRVFLANQFKDLPKNRGELWKLSAFNNLLYFHMEDTLFAAKGKQSMSMKDGSEAFVGSGDIFKQEPNEVIQTAYGFGGTQSQYAAISTRYGYFFIDRKSKKIFLMKDKLSEISKIGMETWFADNMLFTLEPYGVQLDNPIKGFGFHAIYDPKYKRIILTKREIQPSSIFLAELKTNYIAFNSVPSANSIWYNPNTNNFEKYISQVWTVLDWGDSKVFIQDKDGWTISYYLELGVWGSFHDYLPYIYFNTSTDFYSLTDKYNRPAWTITTPLNNHVGTTFGNAGIWKHNSDNNRGILYQENNADPVQYTDKNWKKRVDYYNFEFEFIHNETKESDTLTSSFNYTLETFNQAGVNVLQHGFTKFFLYNTFQMSANAVTLNGIEGTDLEYLINIRRVGNNWKVNHFRDMAALSTSTALYYLSTNTNVIGSINSGTLTTSSTQPMFIFDGMSKVINASYIDLAKSWDQKRKFIDKWVGIRLIYNNISNNLLNLYSTNVEVRKMHR